jgi:hypothetical protein
MEGKYYFINILERRKFRSFFYLIIIRLYVIGVDYTIIDIKAIDPLI